MEGAKPLRLRMLLAPFLVLRNFWKLLKTTKLLHTSYTPNNDRPPKSFTPFSYLEWINKSLIEQILCWFFKSKVTLRITPLIESFLKGGSKPPVLVSLWETLRRITLLRFMSKISWTVHHIILQIVHLVFLLMWLQVLRKPLQQSLSALIRQSADWSVFKVSLEIQAHQFMLIQSRMATRRSFIEGTRGYFLWGLMTLWVQAADGGDQ